MPSDIGVITMAFGAQRYFDQADTLARSLRRTMPDLPLALLTDKPEKGGLFDTTIQLDQFKVPGTLLKIWMYDRSPFDQTLFIDSDCIVVRPFHEPLAEISQFDFSPVMGEFLTAGDEDLWLNDVGEALRRVGGRKFAKFNGGIYFFRKGPVAQEVFERSHKVLDRADELGVLAFDAAGPGEETLIGLALAEMGMEDLYFDGGSFMRTPLNSRGPLTFDVLRGECGFIKFDQRVAPAVCHFCGPWINHPAYRIATRELETGERNAAWRASVMLAHNADRFRKKVIRKLTPAG